jgi:hypothetical protein
VAVVAVAAVAAAAVAVNRMIGRHAVTRGAANGVSAESPRCGEPEGTR